MWRARDEKRPSQQIRWTTYQTQYDQCNGCQESPCIDDLLSKPRVCVAKEVVWRGAVEVPHVVESRRVQGSGLEDVVYTGWWHILVKRGRYARWHVPFLRCDNDVLCSVYGDDLVEEGMNHARDATNYVV